MVTARGTDAMEHSPSFPENDRGKPAAALMGSSSEELSSCTPNVCKHAAEIRAEHLLHGSRAVAALQQSTGNDLHLARCVEVGDVRHAIFPGSADAGSLSLRHLFAHFANFRRGDGFKR